jgi:hypothetical protein
LTSITTTPYAVSARVSPAAYELVDSTATALHLPEAVQPIIQLLIARGRGRKLLAAHQPTARVKRSSVMRVCVGVDPTNHDQGLVLRHAVHGCPS